MMEGREGREGGRLKHTLMMMEDEGGVSVLVSSVATSVSCKGGMALRPSAVSCSWASGAIGPTLLAGLALRGLDYGTRLMAESRSSTGIGGNSPPTPL